jgi:chorismate-pyruvate lyase
MCEIKTHPEVAHGAPTPPDSATYPLDEFYAARHDIMPVIDCIPAAQIPEPYRSLLAHNRDMTSRLEAFHQSKIHIRALARHSQGTEYFREVVLELDGSAKPVEFGASKIMLDPFPEKARDEIRREVLPLGGILRDFGIVFSSRPGAFLRVVADSFVAGVLGLSDAPPLFGRRNTLLDAWGRPMAEIVEILPP